MYTMEYLALAAAGKSQRTNIPYTRLVAMPSLSLPTFLGVDRSCRMYTRITTTSYSAYTEPYTVAPPSHITSGHTLMIISLNVMHVDVLELDGLTMTGATS